MTNTLIVSNCYIDNKEMRDLVVLWAKVVCKLNPDCDILMVDSKSPFDPKLFLKEFPIEIHSFPDNIGHLNRNGKDGWGRAFCYGLDYAVEQAYEYVVSIDGDAMFSRSVSWIIDRMKKANVSVASLWEPTYQFVDSSVIAFTTEFLARSGFTKNYSWPTSDNNVEIPERTCERLIGDDLWILPLRSFRNDFDKATYSQFDQQFQLGTDMLTHCKDHRLYRKFLERNGIVL